MRGTRELPCSQAPDSHSYYRGVGGGEGDDDTRLGPFKFHFCPDIGAPDVNPQIDRQNQGTGDQYPHGLRKSRSRGVSRALPLAPPVPDKTIKKENLSGDKPHSDNVVDEFKYRVDVDTICRNILREPRKHLSPHSKSVRL
jgi:hypothetical protein